MDSIAFDALLTSIDAKYVGITDPHARLSAMSADIGQTSGEECRDLMAAHNRLARTIYGD